MAAAKSSFSSATIKRSSVAITWPSVSGAANKVSSIDNTVPQFIIVTVFRSCSTAICKQSATSSSSGSRPSLAARAWEARSTSRIWRSRERGSQHKRRSSSSIAPRILSVAKDSKRTPRFGSKRCIASSSPSTPACTRSSRLTWAGKPNARRPACKRTSGRY